MAADAIPEDNVGLLRADRLRNYLYLPPGGGLAVESVALLYMPLTLHPMTSVRRIALRNCRARRTGTCAAND